MERNQKPMASKTKISRNVIASIAETSAKEISGVHRLAVVPVSVNSTAFKTPKQKTLSLNPVNDVTIDIRLILDEDAHIPTVAENVQKAVKETIQNMTGVVVSKVNVVVVKIFSDDIAQYN
jgi:uncharacterized alkaline shock family protein YloU